MFLRLTLPLRVPLNAALDRIVSHITGMYKSALRQKKRAVLIRELELILASDSGKLDAVRLGGTAVSSASGTLRW